MASAAFSCGYGSASAQSEAGGGGGGWLEDAAHWRTVFAAAVELKHNPDPLFAELGQALHNNQVTHDRGALAGAFVDIGAPMKGGG